MNKDGELGFVYRFVPSSGSNITLLLLHGTGGDENDLLPIGHQLLPKAALLSPRGRVLENEMPRFFRRFDEGVFDLEDLAIQTKALAKFIKQAADRYKFELAQLIAVGYSNGANIAASLMLTEPNLLRSAVLFRAMVPFVPNSPFDLRNVSALLAAGQRDPIISPQQTSALAKLLEAGGARVSIHWHNGGHELGNDDLAAAKEWLHLWRPPV